MMAYVDGERCTGCGECLEVCLTGALELIDDVAVIDQGKCRACEACMEVCPAGAILSVTEPDACDASWPMRGGATVPVATQPSSISVMSRVRKALPWLGATLAFVGREIVPRMAGALLDAWDRRANNNIAPPGQSSLTSSHTTSRMDGSSDGRRRKFRHRGGRHTA